jgi:hypothetical protein
MKTLAFLGASALAAGSIALSGTFAPAQALTSTGVSCTAASGLFNPMYMECWGAFSGNDVANPNSPSDNSSGLIALLTEYTTNKGLLGTWSASTADKSDTKDTNGVFTSNPETTEGTLTFDSKQVGLFGISLKASNSFSLYLFDGGTEGITSIDFSTIGTSTNDKDKPQDLSHASFFAFTPDDSGDVDVPEPATAAALGTFALLGLAMKKKAKVSA